LKLKCFTFYRYKKGETWDSKFQSLASTMEECRAELCGLYLCVEKDLLSIFGYSGQEAEDIYYVNWLIMVRAGIKALEFFTPTSQVWGQAHMQARYVILQSLISAGEGLVNIQLEENNVFVTLNRSKIITIGRKTVGDFLTRLQIFKSTADVERGTKYYSELSQVPPLFLTIREIVLTQKKPRHVFVQPHTYMEQNEVRYEIFEPNPEGLITSFIKRFDSSFILNLINEN
jgi:dipeptidyl-peptidase-3